MRYWLRKESAAQHRGSGVDFECGVYGPLTIERLDGALDAIERVDDTRTIGKEVLLGGI